MMALSAPWLLATLLLRSLVKRRRHNLCSHTLAANFYFHRRAYGREFRRHIRQRNILLQEWRWRSAGHISNLAPGNIQHFITVPGDAALCHLQAHERTLHAFSFSFFESRASDELGLLHFAEAVQASFPNINRIGNLVPVEREFAFKAQSVASAQTAGNDAKLFARAQNLIPNPSADGFIRRNVNLKPVLCRVPGARNQNIVQSTDRTARNPIELYRAQIRVRQLLQDVNALRPLYCNLGKVVGKILDGAIKLPRIVADPIEIFLARTRVDHQQVLILAQAMNDDIVDKRSLRIEQR